MFDNSLAFVERLASENYQMQHWEPCPENELGHELAFDHRLSSEDDVAEAKDERKTDP